jgi:glycosyltransferase involved in cell wall biosynthesis
MKIGFDGKRAAQNFTGLGNYSRYALEALAKYYPDEEYRVYIPKDVDNPKFEDILSAAGGVMKKVLPHSAAARRLKSLWRVWGVTKSLATDGVQVFHGLSNELPLNIRKVSPGVKSVVTIHDVIFRRLPGCYPVIDRMIYDYKFRRACRNADHVIAVSECTKRDIVNDYGISPDKVSVIYQGCDPLFAESINKERMAEIKAKYSLPDKFIVSVGTIEERKNLLSVVKSLLLLPDDIHLVAVGRRTKYTALVDKFVAENHLEHRVHLLHGVPYVDLPAIYQCADVFAYMSLYEGFGIPLLEALNSRVPVVAATGSCLEEAGGPGSIYVEPFDVAAIAGAVKRCLLPDVKEAMVAAGLEWAARFSMERFAHETMDCYKMLTDEK